MTRCPVSHKFCSWGPCSEELQQGSCLFTFVVKSQLFVYFGFKTVDLLLNLSSLKALSRLYTYTRISKPRLWVSCLFTFAVEISAVCLQSDGKSQLLVYKGRNKRALFLSFSPQADDAGLSLRDWWCLLLGLLASRFQRSSTDFHGFGRHPLRTNVKIVAF